MKTATFAFEEGRAIESVEQFLSEIGAGSGGKSFRWYFRGEPQQSRKLQPSIGRAQFYAGSSLTFSQEQERSLLHRFRRHAYSHFQRVPTEWETLFLARHHGLPTRLLDWTANPLVALYFAAFHENDKITYRGDNDETATVKLNLDGTVWAIECREDAPSGIDVFDTALSPLQVPGIRLIQPFHPTPRLTAQSGVFTLHGDPWSDVVECAGKDYRNDELDITRLKRWQITSRYKSSIIVALERLAINSRTLFPDLDGLAKGLWQTEIIRQAPPA
jgi:hypothetical protein